MKATNGLKRAPRPEVAPASRMTGPDLREWMTVNDYTAQRLANVLGVTERTVFRWRGEDGPPPFLPLALVTLEGAMIVVAAPEDAA